MANCLGLYVEDNIIKYAKVSKDRETLKVESFGIKFYDKLGEAINQIISETYSFKTPISINLSEETYNYFSMFSLLNKNDLKKAIDTEYEALCFDKNTNKNAFEVRYAITNSIADKDKLKIIHVSTNKTTVNRTIQQLEGKKVSSISPIGISIANVAKINPKENIAIINLENKTTITTIINQKVYNVDKLDIGAEEILENIKVRENSYLKAYEICKNTTIYTMEGRELQDKENEYLDDIMPTLYKIVEKSKDILLGTEITFDKIYITGILSVINNIDLYFQEFFMTEKCEILKPYFITDNIKINIKDYIEVNSAIALALQGLGYGIKEMNFRKASFSDSLPDWLKIEISSDKSSNKLSKAFPNFSFKFDLNEKLDSTEKWMIRVCAGVFALVLIYCAFSIMINNQINKKTEEILSVKSDTITQIALEDRDIESVKSKTNKYIELTRNLQEANDELAANNKSKNAIPTLLSELMYIIPKDVQITSIENTTGTHIIINVQSRKYEQLGYFKVKIKSDGILDPSTVVSSTAIKEGDLVKTVIEGDLP